MRYINIVKTHFDVVSSSWRSLNSTKPSTSMPSLSTANFPKRLYKNVSVVKCLDPSVNEQCVLGKRTTLSDFFDNIQNVFEVRLDNRLLKSPRGHVFRTYSEPLAFAVAQEWVSQHKEIRKDLMLLTGLTFTSLDNPFNETKESMVARILEFLATDTLLYFADSNNSLFDEQEKHWMPIIKWANKQNNFQLKPSRSIVDLPQVPDSSLSRLKMLLMCYNFPALIGINYAADAAKSLLIVLACASHFLEFADAAKLARLELLYQTKVWGNVEWAHSVDEYETSCRLAAGVLFFNLCSNTEDKVYANK